MPSVESIVVDDVVCTRVFAAACFMCITHKKRGMDSGSALVPRAAVTYFVLVSECKFHQYYIRTW